MTKVSIIVPVYNSEKYLGRCIESILRQTYKDIELILVNDGSLDNSGDICDIYSEKDRRVRVIHKENGGVSTARNAGIDAAKGQYIMFVDSDDYIDENMLEDMLREIKTADMAISSVEMIDNVASNIYTIKTNIYTPKELIEEYSMNKFPIICICGPWSKLFKKEIIVKYDIRFDSQMRIGEDTYFNMMYIKRCQKIVAMENVYYFYIRENTNSLYSKFRDYYYDDIMKVHKVTLEVAQILNCSNETLTQLMILCVNQLIVNTRKAILTADKKTCIDYMKKVRENAVVSENMYLIKNKLKRLFIRLIQMKFYNTAYYLWKIREKARMEETNK